MRKTTQEKWHNLERKLERFHRKRAYKKTSAPPETSAPVNSPVDSERRGSNSAEHEDWFDAKEPALFGEGARIKRKLSPDPGPSDPRPQ